MINIGICDDDEVIVNDLEKLIKNCGLPEKFAITKYKSGEMLLDTMKKDNYKCDILFMDIELEDEKIGTNIAVMLKQQNPDMLVIYISAYNNYYEVMVQAEPFRFLSKPVTGDKMRDTLNDAYERLKKYKLEYAYDYNGEKNIINLWNISYIYSRHRKVFVCFRTGKEIYFYGKLDEVEQEINNICNFFGRVNKSYLINIYAITSFTRERVYINNLCLIISSKYKESMSEKLITDRLGGKK